MSNIIVRESAGEIRAIARNALKGNWVKVIIGVLVFYLLSTTVPLLITVLLPNTITSYYFEAMEQSISVSYVANLYTAVLNGALTVGFCSFFLNFFRRKDINVGYLFNGFEYFFKAFALMFMYSLFVFLWTLLLIVPGIIAVFRYSQAFYILADHPEKGVMECLRESKVMMTGNKGKFFCLALSFIGWAILASVVVFWVPVLSGIAGIVLDLAASVPYLFFLAYMTTAETAFYDLVSGNLQAMPKEEENYYF